MLPLRIPEPYIEGLRKLASLSAEDFQSITSALERARPKLKAAEITVAIQDYVPHIAPKDLQEILEVASSLIGTAGTQEEITIEKFVADLLEAMQRSPGRFATAPILGWEGFRDQITSLLSAKTLRISSRADDVQHEQANVFTGVRVLSDIRTVFDPDTVDAQGALIIHQLKLTYFHNGEYQDVYIAMDNADLKSLRSAIERAERKTEALINILKRASVTYFESAGTI